MDYSKPEVKPFVDTTSGRRYRILRTNQGLEARGNNYFRLLTMVDGKELEMIYEGLPQGGYRPIADISADMMIEEKDLFLEAVPARKPAHIGELVTAIMPPLPEPVIAGSRA
jgi:hypothetical protein